MRTAQRSVSVPQAVASILRDHVTLAVESIDRLYLNVYVPKLQRTTPAGKYLMVGFFREQRGATFASSALTEPMARAFVTGMEWVAKRQGVSLIGADGAQRQNDVANQYLAEFRGAEGVLFISYAQ